MSVRNRRLVVAGVVAAAAVAVPIAALASGSGSPSEKPPPPAASRSATAPELQKLATTAGISVARMQAGLVAAKHAGPDNSRRIAAFAAAAHVSATTAERIVHATFGTQVDRSFTRPAAVAALAGRLGVSRSAAQHALQQLSALSGRNGIDPASPAFRAIAHALGVSPARLASGLASVKRAMAGN